MFIATKAVVKTIHQHSDFRAIHRCGHDRYFLRSQFLGGKLAMALTDSLSGPVDAVDKSITDYLITLQGWKKGDACPTAPSLSASQSKVCFCSLRYGYPHKNMYLMLLGRRQSWWNT